MSKFAFLWAAAFVLAAAAPPAAAAGGAPVVVELYTSEGCSSCPPADAFLGELARRSGVVALGFHVDYWDYIGWKDPFAFREATERQRRYTDALGNRYLYTPEMVIDGRRDATGSDRETVSKLIDDEARSVRKLELKVSETGAESYTVGIPASSFTGGATVWVALFDREHDTDVARGENEGHTLKEFNVVRELRSIGRYDGKEQHLTLGMELTAANGCAVLVQSDYKPGDGQGAMLGAALVERK